MMIYEWGKGGLNEVSPQRALRTPRAEWSLGEADLTDPLKYLISDLS